MKKKLGRPRLKAKERKEIVPMRLSAIELKILKAAAKGQPLTTWMRETLLTAAGYKEYAKMGLAAMVNEATGFTAKPTDRLSPSIPPSSSPVRTPTVPLSR